MFIANRLGKEDSLYFDNNWFWLQNDDALILCCKISQTRKPISAENVSDILVSVIFSYITVISYKNRYRTRTQSYHPCKADKTPGS